MVRRAGLLAYLAAADARALVRQALEDSQIVRPGRAFENANLDRIGVDVSRGDPTFVLDFNETTDQDLAAIGLQRNEILKLRSAVHALETRRTPSRFDRWYKDELQFASPLRRTLQAARLLSFIVKLRALGVSAANPGDLLELTASDLRAVGMRGVPLRRFRAALHNLSSPSLPAAAALSYTDDAVAPFLTRAARLTDSIADPRRERAVARREKVQPRELGRAEHRRLSVAESTHTSETTTQSIIGLSAGHGAAPMRWGRCRDMSDDRGRGVERRPRRRNKYHQHHRDPLASHFKDPHI